MRISDWSSDVCSSDLPEGRIGAAGELGQVVAETEGHGPCIVGSVQIADPPKFGMRVDDVSLLVVVTHRALYLESGVVEGRCGGTARAVGIRATTRRNEPLRPVELRPVLPSVEEHNLRSEEHTSELQ